MEGKEARQESKDKQTEPTGCQTAMSAKPPMAPLPHPQAPQSLTPLLIPPFSFHPNCHGFWFLQVRYSNPLNQSWMAPSPFVPSFLLVPNIALGSDGSVSFVSLPPSAASGSAPHLRFLPLNILTNKLPSLRKLFLGPRLHPQSQRKLGTFLPNDNSPPSSTEVHGPQMTSDS